MIKISIILAALCMTLGVIGLTQQEYGESTQYFSIAYVIYRLDRMENK